MRLTVDSERTEISVNREFDPNRWNAISGPCAGTKEDAKTLNAYLDTLQIKVHEIHRELLAVLYSTAKPYFLNMAIFPILYIYSPCINK